MSDVWMRTGLVAALLVVAAGCGSDRPALPGPIGSGPPLAPALGARTTEDGSLDGDAGAADAESNARLVEIPSDPAERGVDGSGSSPDSDSPDSDSPDRGSPDSDAIEVAEVDGSMDSSSSAEAIAAEAIAIEEHADDRSDVGSPASALASAGSRVDPDHDEGPREEPGATGASDAERAADGRAEDGEYLAKEGDEEDLTGLDDAEDPAAMARRSAEEAAAAALLEALSAVEDDEPERVPTVDHASFDAILRATVRGDRVDYDALKRDHAGRLKAYLDQLAEVDDRALLWGEERLAFYINLYNASMFQAVLDRYTEGWTPAADSFRVFDDKVVRLKDRQISLNHLENEIIRKEFVEPRIHVALVCGARSCPTIRDRAYDPRTLDETLDENMRGFLASGFRNRVDRRNQKLLLSHIFDWYADDFGGKDRVAAYVDRYVSGDVSGYAVEFIEYQWDLNASR